MTRQAIADLIEAASDLTWELTIWSTVLGAVVKLALMLTA